MKKEWINNSREEQETIINIDYCDKTISVYTTRKQVGERLYKKFGEPDNIDYLDGKISGVEYRGNLYDKDVSKYFSKTILIGNFAQKNIEEQND